MTIRGTFLVLMLSALAFFLRAQQMESLYAPGQVYVKLKHFDAEVQFSSEPNRVFELASQYGLIEHSRPFNTLLPGLGAILRLKISQAHRIDQFLSQLNRLPEVEYAEAAIIPVIFARNTFLPGQIHPKNEWYFNRINIRRSWDYYALRGGTSVVAVVDNAIYIQHEALRNNLWVNKAEIAGNGIDDDGNGFVDDVNGASMVTRTGEVGPPSMASGRFFSHGTHVAGLTTTNPELENGIFSIGFNTKLMAIRAAADADSLTGGLSFAFEGLAYAIARQPDVINLSWGLYTRSKVLEDLIQKALENGIIVVAAAGNYGESIPTYPANLPGVVAVGATDNDDRRLGSSQYGNWLGVNAPGQSILSCVNTGTKEYAELSGTSMACGIVSGFAGLLVSQFPKRKEVIPLAIKMGADNIDRFNPGYEGLLGSGRINVDYSIDLLNDPNLSSAEYSVENLTVFPNPFHDKIYIQTEGSQQFDRILIYDITGRMVGDFDLPASWIEPGNLPAGLYLIKAIDANGAVYQARVIRAK